MPYNVQFCEHKLSQLRIESLYILKEKLLKIDQLKLVALQNTVKVVERQVIILYINRPFKLII